MISICIPVYNFDVVALVEELTQQAKKLNIPYEIILIDDCSTEAYRKINKEVCEKENYITLDKNIGRAKIRNLFLNYSTYNNLLFLDCDSLIISKDFLLKYIDSIIKNNDTIICGGRVYDKQSPGRNKMLRWKYGIKKESQPLAIRQISPNKSFMTNNFLIRRKTLDEIKFDERIIDYGHEDTLFGFRLKKRGIHIKHIDNPVLNKDIENNIEYLKKTEKGIINLIYILNYVDYNNDFIQDIKILNFYKKMTSMHLTGIFNILFSLLKPLFKFLLSHDFINLQIFDIYKLGILSQNYKYHTEKAISNAQYRN